jgi:hypothetical protein
VKRLLGRDGVGATALAAVKAGREAERAAAFLSKALTLISSRAT